MKIDPKTIVWLIVALVGGFLAAGLPYWPIPYNKVELPTPLFTQCLIPFSLVAFLVALLSRLGILRTALAVALGAPAAIMLRVIVEVTKDPTSHNLWPFEIVIGSVAGMMIALPAAAIGGLLHRMFRGSKASESQPGG